MGKGGMQRACFACGSLEHVIKDCPRNPRIQQVEDETPEVLFIGNVKGEEWKQVPMKIKLGDFMRTPMNKVMSTTKVKNRFRVLEVDEKDADEDGEMHVRAVDCAMNEEMNVGEAVRGGRVGEVSTMGKDDAAVGRRAPGTTKSCMATGCRAPHSSTRRFIPQPGTQRAVVNDESKGGRKDGMEEVKHVMAVETGNGWASLGMGDIVIDSAADESCWPVGQGDAYLTKPSKRNMILKTANGGEMGHYGQKEVTFKHAGGADPIGLTFQVTDVKKPLLAVRRLVEKGNKVVLSGDEGESYILNPQSKVRVPVRKKGGSFVIEAHFVKEITPGFARPA